MDQLSFKTRFLNQIRLIGKLPMIEQVIVRHSQNKPADNLAAKVAPNNYQYPHGTIRNCERDGIKYSLDISDYMQHCIYFGIEIEPRKRLYDLVRNGTTIIDVGTNIGETLLNFAKRNRDGSNIGFEPVPYLFEKARQNLRLNGSRNVTLHNIALSDTEGELHFNIVDENNSGGIYLSSEREKTSSGIVHAVRLDDFVSREKLNNISLIKIDVEGFEMNVLKGAAETLRHFKPTLFVEVNDSFLRRQQSTAGALIEYIREQGYQISHAETGEAIYTDSDLEGKHFDIVCIPEQPIDPSASQKLP